MKQKIVLGTRGSALALRQVELVSAALRTAWPELEIGVETITTSGDRDVNLSLVRATPTGAKGLFTREIEEVLRAGRIDVAVHSLKDLPGQMVTDLAVVAVLPRAPSGDTLISREGFTLASLPEGATLGTSSVRREKQLTRLRPDLRIVELRGNVPTRLQKLRDQPELHGIVLAEAGLHRLGYSADTERLEGLQAVSLAEHIFPAVGQGIVALQVRADDGGTATVLAGMNDSATWIIARAEREFLRLLDGDCRLPVGVRTRVEGDRLQMATQLFTGGKCLEATEDGSSECPESVSVKLYNKLYA